jgi:hypothetical protein
MMRLAANMAAIMLFAGVGPAAAHGLGERYDLPLPLGLYLFGAAPIPKLDIRMATPDTDARSGWPAATTAFNSGRPVYGFTNSMARVRA